MFGKILGIGDIYAVLIIMLMGYLPGFMIAAAAWFLILKGFMFGMMRSMISWLDVVAGIYILVLSAGFGHWSLTLGVVLFLGQKGVLSLL